MYLVSKLLRLLRKMVRIPLNEIQVHINYYIRGVCNCRANKKEMTTSFPSHHVASFIASSSE